MAVFTKVAHMAHRPTLIKEMIKALSELESLVMVFTIIKTNSNQTTGETGLKICISQLKELLNTGLKPITIPIGTAIINANKKPAKTVLRLVKIY